ncbi:ATP-dependent helicase [Belnapia sp. F-4-1]|uniref:ATP-dependent helicase n=1 Tax=Belnapia sp. F-4-1 TaxID=1545443 RepID=UPI0005BBC54D|nr:ATP-dependent helicase [Belnapia sp. F-4-1]
MTHIRRFGRDYRAAPPALKLETNYRSTPTILRAANAIAAEDPEALPKILRPADPKAPPGPSITIWEAPTAEDEGRGVLTWLQALRRRQPELLWRACAVLVRAGFVAEPILAALRQANVPMRLVTDREPEPPKEVLAVIAWLRLAMSRGRGGKPGAPVWDPAADDAFRRACAFPARGIGGTVFGRLREHATERGLALAAAVGTLPATPAERQGLEAVLGVAGEIADGVARRKLGPADALRLAAEASELAERLGPDGRLGNAWTAALRAAEQVGSVAAYCDGAALGTMPGEAEPADAVQVLTLHRAKGLEFDHVLLAGLEEGVWPNWQAEQQGAIAEERRLFYVGVTRARHSLRLSWVRHRRDWAAKPSRFLAEIPKALTGAGTASWQAKGSGPASRTAAGRPARPVKPPSQAETDRLVVEFTARKAAKAPR